MECVLGWHASEELVQCASDALQKEWPRSRGNFYSELVAHGIASEGTYDFSKLSQASFIFFRKSDRAFIGHIRVSRAAPASANRAVCFTFVLVSPCFRGKGWGRSMMREVEERARCAFDYAYLWTTSAVEFYKKIGYHECAPISPGNVFRVGQWSRDA